MNLAAKQRLAEVVKTARGKLSQRAFARELGVSLRAVQGWENAESVPSAENLNKIAVRAGYTLKDLMEHVEGKPLEQPTDLDQILKQIKLMPLQQVAAIGHAVADRLAAVAKEYKAG